MQAYHNDPKIKEKYVNRMKEHIKADQLVRGIGFEDGRGCAVGCTLDNYNHSQYPIELGIPEWLAYVEDMLFEHIEREKSELFPLEFLETIKEGADLDKIKAPFFIYLLELALTTFDHQKYPQVLKAIQDVIFLYEKNETDVDKFNTAAFACEKAYIADANGVYASDVAQASEAAVYAARATFYTSKRAYSYAAHAVYPYANNNFADKLLQLLKNCK